MEDFDQLPFDTLQAMAAAAAEVKNCRRVLAKTGDTILTELLRGSGAPAEWRHYPPGDVYDAEHHSQYYYHSHAAAERRPGEHGHFHTFLRPLGMPAGVKPAPLPDVAQTLGENDALSHLAGISVDAGGEVTRLFTTNRWVTGETWYVADDVAAMLDCFVIDHARPSWPLNRWITAVMRLYRPQIVELLRRRDAALAEAAGADGNPYEDRELETPSEIDIDAETHIRQVERAWRAARRRIEGR